MPVHKVRADCRVDESERFIKAVQQMIGRKLWSPSNRGSVLKRHQTRETSCPSSGWKSPFWGEAYFTTHPSLDSLRRSQWLVDSVVCGKGYAPAFLMLQPFSIRIPICQIYVNYKGYENYVLSWKFLVFLCSIKSHNNLCWIVSTLIRRIRKQQL